MKVLFIKLTTSGPLNPELCGLSQSNGNTHEFYGVAYAIIRSLITHESSVEVHFDGTEDSEDLSIFQESKSESKKYLSLSHNPFQEFDSVKVKFASHKHQLDANYDIIYLINGSINFWGGDIGQIPERIQLLINTKARLQYVLLDPYLGFQKSKSLLSKVPMYQIVINKFDNNFGLITNGLDVNTLSFDKSKYMTPNQITICPNLGGYPLWLFEQNIISHSYILHQQNQQNNYIYFGTPRSERIKSIISILTETANKNTGDNIYISGASQKKWEKALQDVNFNWKYLDIPRGLLNLYTTMGQIQNLYSIILSSKEYHRLKFLPPRVYESIMFGGTCIFDNNSKWMTTRNELQDIQKSNLTLTTLRKSLLLQIYAKLVNKELTRVQNL